MLPEKLTGPGYEYGCLVNADNGAYLVTHVARATTRATNRRGLLGLDGLGPGTGLLLSDPVVHMHGMGFALDLVLLGWRGQVLTVHANVHPGWKLYGHWRARRTLELAAGEARACRLRPGVSVRFEQDKNSRPTAQRA